MGPPGEPAAEVARQVDLYRRGVSSLATTFAESVYTTAIQTVLDGRKSLPLVVGVAPRDTSRVVFPHGKARRRARNAGLEIKKRLDFNQFATLDASIRAAFGSVDFRLHTAQLGAVETADFPMQQSGACAATR